MIKIIECPRDAMQGIKDYIPVDLKVEYLNALLKVGFDSIDFGSFVSPRAVPQMHDTRDVLKKIKLEDSVSSLIAIIANLRGAEDICKFEEIDYMGYPFSISEIFQQNNANSSIEQSLSRVDEIHNLAYNNNKELIIYLSMAFGNPYDEPWNFDLVAKWVEKLTEIGINTISLADTAGVATPETIQYLFSNLIPEFFFIEFGAHFHSRPDLSLAKIQSAYQSGCQRFDGALLGFGGCPFTNDALVGNIDTRDIVSFVDDSKLENDLNMNALKQAIEVSQKIFAKYK